jgi:hypothetical protein
MTESEYRSMVHGIMMYIDVLKKIPPKPIYTPPKEIQDAVNDQKDYNRNNIGFRSARN